MVPKGLETTPEGDTMAIGQERMDGSPPSSVFKTVESAGVPYILCPACSGKGVRIQRLKAGPCRNRPGRKISTCQICKGEGKMPMSFYEEFNAGRIATATATSEARAAGDVDAPADPNRCLRCDGTGEICNVCHCPTGSCRNVGCHNYNGETCPECGGKG